MCIYQIQISNVYTKCQNSNVYTNKDTKMYQVIKGKTSLKQKHNIYTQ